MSDIEKDPFATEMQEDKPSTGRFRILRYHARGGLGQIAIALDQEFNREIALKSIREEYSNSELHQEKFDLLRKLISIISQGDLTGAPLLENLLISLFEAHIDGVAPPWLSVSILLLVPWNRSALFA